MKNVIYLILGIGTVIHVVDSFLGDATTEFIFGIEMNSWLYRLFWSVIASILLYGTYKERKRNTEHDS